MSGASGGEIALALFILLIVICAPILYGFLIPNSSSSSGSGSKRNWLDELYEKEKNDFHGKDETHFIDSLDPHKRHYHALQILNSIPVFSLAPGYYPFLSKGCFSHKYADAFVSSTVLLGASFDDGVSYGSTDKAIPLIAITKDLETVLLCSGGKLGTPGGKIYRMTRDSITSCEIVIDSNTNITTNTVKISPERTSKVNQVINRISLRIATNNFEYPVHQILISDRRFDLGKAMDASDQASFKEANDTAAIWQARLLMKSEKKTAPKKTAPKKAAPKEAAPKKTAPKSELS